MINFGMPSVLSPHEMGAPPREAGDADAHSFAEEIQSHEPSLCAYLRLRFPWLPDVDEIAHEAVIRMWHWRSRSNGGKLKSPRAVLYSIARNLAFDLGRRRAVAEINSVAEIEHLSVLDEHSDIAEIVSTHQELEFLAEALRNLPDGCRQVLTLSKMHGYKPREIAARLGISVHTVRAQTAKGMRRCAEYLRHRGVSRP